MKTNRSCLPKGRPESRPLMTQEQVATRLGLSRATVNNDEDNALRKIREERIARGWPVPGERHAQANN